MAEYRCRECGHEFDENDALNVAYDGKTAICPYFHMPDTLDYLYGFGFIGVCGYGADLIEDREVSSVG